jgi:hypothetical protein
MPDSATKHCTKCGEVKPLAEFRRRADSPDGHQGSCKQCRSAADIRHYEANRDRVLDERRAYYRANRAVIREQNRQWYEAHKEWFREWARQDYAANPQKAREKSLRVRGKLRARVFGHYGVTCACCGTTEHLSIDHVNGDGAAHREEIPKHRSTDALYRWLVKEGFPEGYQTLCVRCNQSKARGERCRIDHTERRMTLGSYLDRDAILKAAALRTEDVPVPEWGGSVLVRELRGRERDEWEGSLAVQRGSQMVPDTANMRAKLAARVIVGEDLEPLFTQQDVAALGELSAAALDRVFDVASRLSGLGQGAVEEAGKTSGSILPGGSTST